MLSGLKIHLHQPNFEEHGLNVIHEASYSHFKPVVAIEEYMVSIFFDSQNHTGNYSEEVV